MIKYEQSFPVFLVMFILFLVVFLFITVSNTCFSKPEVIDVAETTSEFTCTVEEVYTPAYYIVTEEERYELRKQKEHKDMLKRIAEGISSSFFSC